MKKFIISNIRNASVITIFRQREGIYMDAEYQRISDIWPLTKRQLLIDSLINGYDVPKFYFHEFNPPKRIKGHSFNHAVIDGKQRLMSIWGFLNNDFPLAEDFEFIEDDSIKMGGLTYKEVSDKYPEIRDLFNATFLDIVTIIVEDVEFIEDMFSRLNEAMPLNAAEKRNAFGGPMPKAIRRLAKHSFFSNKIPFKNARFRYLELATKFLFINHNMISYAEKIPDTSKKRLDEFVKSYKVNNRKISAKKNRETLELEKGCEEILSAMEKVFVNIDPLLRSIGMIIIYFILFCDVELNAIKRKDLVNFKKKREENRRIAEEDMAGADYDLLEFDRLIQSPNDKSALKFRLDVIENFLGFVEKE